MSSPGDIAQDRAAPAEAAPFVWPPVQPPPPGHESRPAVHVPAQPPPARPRPRWRGALLDLEAAFLTPTAEPFPLRALRAGWTPDPFQAFCDRCGRSVGPHETAEFGCARCRSERIPWERFVRLGAHAGCIRDCVHDVKFTRWRRLGVDLGHALGRRLLDAGFPARDPRACVVPVAMAWTRRLARGVDHAAAIAEGVAAATNAELFPALSRRPGASQRAVPASRREANVSRAFALRPGVRLEGRVIALIDDVKTTGATLRAACRAIHGGRLPRGGPRGEAGMKGSGEEGPRVWAAVVGVAPEPGEGDGGGANAGAGGA